MDMIPSSSKELGYGHRLMYKDDRIFYVQVQD